MKKILFRKDDFGHWTCRLTITKMFLIAIGILIALYGWMEILTGCNGIEEIPEIEIIEIDTENFVLDEPPVLLDTMEPPEMAPSDLSKERHVLYHYYSIRPLELTTNNVTCYSRFDSATEARKIYANNNFKRIPIQERRIQRHHFTVAVNYDAKIFHESLIEVEGEWMHKFRFHVPEYNSDKKPSNDLDVSKANIIDYKDVFNSDYFSVPRDRMGRMMKCRSCGNRKMYGGTDCDRCGSYNVYDEFGDLGQNRLDVLFTGYESKVKQRQRKWGTKKLTSEIWIIEKWVRYSDNTKEMVD